MTILNKIPGGWWYGVCERSGGKGYFPESFVKEYDVNAVVENVHVVSKSGAPKWKSAVDKRYNRVYYVNSLTGESTWTRPEDFDGVDAEVEAGLRKEKKIAIKRREDAEYIRKRQKSIATCIYGTGVETFTDSAGERQSFSYEKHG